MSIYESGEDYLLAILVIKERKGLCHSIDVAEETGYSKASVSIAMKKLLYSDESRWNFRIVRNRPNHCQKDP